MAGRRFDRHCRHLQRHRLLSAPACSADAIPKPTRSRDLSPALASWSLFVLLPITPVTTILFTAALGLLWLSTVPLTMGLVTVMFGTRYMATLYGFVFLSHQIGSFFGVWLGGLFHDLYGSYDPVWWMWRSARPLRCGGQLADSRAARAGLRDMIMRWPGHRLAIGLLGVILPGLPAWRLPFAPRAATRCDRANDSRLRARHRKEDMLRKSSPPARGQFAKPGWASSGWSSAKSRRHRRDCSAKGPSAPIANCP